MPLFDGVVLVRAVADVQLLQDAPVQELRVYIFLTYMLDFHHNSGNLAFSMN